MAKAFKWLLPGAVKKTTTKKTTKSNRTLERNKKVQQRSDIQPFFSNHTHSRHIYARLFSLTGNSLIPTLPHISLVKRNTVLNWGNTKTARHIPAFRNLKWQRNKLIWTSETKYVESDEQRRLSDSYSSDPCTKHRCHTGPSKWFGQWSRPERWPAGIQTAPGSESWWYAPRWRASEEAAWNSG